jgi:hypothetical protein
MNAGHSVTRYPMSHGTAFRNALSQALRKCPLGNARARDMWSAVGVPGDVRTRDSYARGGAGHPPLQGPIVTKERLPVWQEIAPQARMVERKNEDVVSEW